MGYVVFALLHTSRNMDEGVEFARLAPQRHCLVRFSETLPGECSYPQRVREIKVASVWYGAIYVDGLLACGERYLSVTPFASNVGNMPKRMRQQRGVVLVPRKFGRSAVAMFGIVKTPLVSSQLSTCNQLPDSVAHGPSEFDCLRRGL
jgi:hypothetical protein